jgi:hypothetical protein
MEVTFIVTVDPVKDPLLLSLSVLSLNLQTCRRFNVVFYNQTLTDEASLLNGLAVKPAFDYEVVSIDRESFFGRYPLWDLHAVHQALLDRQRLNEYFISLHMEEFLDPDYLEHLLPVLEAQQLDILFGNLTRSRLPQDAWRGLLDAGTAPLFDAAIERSGARHAPHFSFDFDSVVTARSPAEIRRRVAHCVRFGLRRRFKPTAAGCTALRTYFAEDVYWMRRDFALRHGWFLRGRHLYFEDVHICQQKGVCELGKELERITRFPVYFNQRRIYHVPHATYYYQLLDEEFTAGLLACPVKDPVLEAHRTAIRRLQRGEFTFRQALGYTRQNPEGTGTQNLNYRLHMLGLAGSVPGRRPRDEAVLP